MPSKVYIEANHKVSGLPSKLWTFFLSEEGFHKTSYFTVCDAKLTCYETVLNLLTS